MNKYSLPGSIVLAALLISSAVFFHGLQFGLSQDTLQPFIDQGIENFVAKQNEATEPPVYTDQDFSDDDPFLGDKDAPVTIVEFTDFECYFCQRNFETVFPLIKENYIDTGIVKYVVRDAPLGMHSPPENPAAMREALASNCVLELAGEETFFDFHDLLFTTAAASEALLSEEITYNVAGQFGVDKVALKECVDSGKYNNEVAKDLYDFESLNFSGTPAFIVGGYTLPGALSYEAFVANIDKALADAGL